MKEQSLISFLTVELAGIPHAEAIVGFPEMMNKQSLIPLPPTKSAKQKQPCDRWQRDLIPLFWMVLCISILLVPFFWIKSSGAEELTIVNSNCNGDENGASAIKGGTFLWRMRLGQGCSFYVGGAIQNLDFFIDRVGSLVWHRRKKKMP
jgi:hypothetical protein